MKSLIRTRFSRTPYNRAAFNRKQGFSLIELMIVVAVIGIISVVALPAYNGYIETAKMTKVTANFQEAVRLAQNTFSKDRTLVTLGIQAVAPDNAADWIKMFNPSDVQAPGGGPAYIDAKEGDNLTGAIGVRWRNAKIGRSARLELRRPSYISLVRQRARITVDGEIKVNVHED